MICTAHQVLFGCSNLRRIFGPKRAVVTRKWRRLRTEEFYGLQSPNIIRMTIIKNERGEHVTVVREKIGAYRVFVGRPEGSRPFGRPGCR
jgi:hypothetical protein